jgi:hypothetical protein
LRGALRFTLALLFGALRSGLLLIAALLVSRTLNRLGRLSLTPWLSC